jgi:hypothetical protein
LKNRLVSNGIEVVYNQLEADFIVYLNGCLTNCAQEFSEGQTPHTVVAAETVDSAAIGENEIVDQILSKINQYI